MIRHLNEDDCLDLLRGLLGNEQREAALRHVSTCAACERMFADHAAHEERVRSRGKLRGRPDGAVTLEPHIPGEPFADEPDIRAIPRVFPLKRYLRVAAVTAAAAAVLLLFVLPGSQQPPTTASLYALPAAGEQIYLRGETGIATDDYLETGIDSYSRGDLREAAEILQKADATGQRETLRRIYLGSALARLGDFAGAAEILESISFVGVPDPWGGEGRWTLYVALAATGRTAEAEEILIELSREPGTFGDRAREALEHN